MTSAPVPAETENLAPYPEGALAVHIGPPKTGTTSLQGAFDRARAEIAAQGVRYLGPRRHSSRAVLAATDGTTDRPFDSRAGLREWNAIVAEARTATEPRLLFSSERLAYADSPAIRRVVEDFGPERVHVVVTLRPLAKILPSQWQQHVQSGIARPLDAWLERLLAASADTSRSAWHRLRQDRLIARWADVVGTERMLVIVVDDRDRQGLLRTFEHLLALRPGTLRLYDDLANRSLTLPEAEALRSFNRLAREREMPSELRWRLLGPRTSRRLQRRKPAADEAPVRVPAWAAPRVAAITDEIVAGIRSSGVRVIGDLAVLQRPAETLAPDPEATSGTPEVAGSLAMALLAAGGALPWPPDADGAVRDRLDRVSSRRIAFTLASRLRRSAATAVRIVRDRLP